MVKRAAHAGNTLIQLACLSADALITGGAGAGLVFAKDAAGTALSAWEVLPKDHAHLAPAADRFDTAFKTALSEADLTADQQDTAHDMLRHSGYCGALALKLNKDPHDIADHLHETLKGSPNADHRPPFMRAAFRTAFLAAYTPLASDPDFAGLLSGEFQNTMLERMTQITQVVGELAIRKESEAIELSRQAEQAAKRREFMKRMMAEETMLEMNISFSDIVRILQAMEDNGLAPHQAIERLQGRNE